MNSELNKVFSYMEDEALGNLDEEIFKGLLSGIGKPISVNENKEPIFDYGDTRLETWATAKDALANGTYGDKTFALYKIYNELSDISDAISGGEDSKIFGVETNPYKTVLNVLKEASESFKGIGNKTGGMGGNTGPTINGGYPNDFSSSKSFDPIKSIDSINTVNSKKEEEEEKKEEVHNSEDVDIDSSYAFESNEKNETVTDLSEDENVNIDSSYTFDNNSGGIEWIM